MPLGGPIESVVGVVVRHYDGTGNLTQVNNITGSIRGITPDRPGFGTYVVNADCTGIVRLQPAPGVFIVERIVIADNGHEVRSIAADPPQLMVSAVGRGQEDVTAGVWQGAPAASRFIRP